MKPERRWDKGRGYRRKYKGKWGQPLMAKAVGKYNWDEIKHEILYKGLTKEEAEAKEIELIAKYKSNNPEFGYNIENGGNTPGKLSEETKKKLSEINSGENHPQYGTHRSDEIKKKISETEKALNKKLTKEQKEAVSKAQSVPVICIETNVIYPSMTIAEEKTNIKQSNISMCCQGKRKTAGGYHWKSVI